MLVKSMFYNKNNFIFYNYKLLSLIKLFVNGFIKTLINYKKINKFFLFIILFILIIFYNQTNLTNTTLSAQNLTSGINIPVIPGLRAAQNPKEASFSLFLILLLSLLSLAPALIMMITSFTKVIIVFDFIRRALSLQNMPPNQVLFGLAIFVSAFIMVPTIKEFNEKALEPYINGKSNTTSFIEEGMKPFRKFMITQIGKDGAKEVGLFVSLSGKEPESIKKIEDIDSYILVPAFMLSEIKKAFIIGILIFIPFIIVDLVVASTLMSMGMIMLPPALISLPFKIVLFILVDGWHIITYNLVRSYNVSI